MDREVVSTATLEDFVDRWCGDAVFATEVGNAHFSRMPICKDFFTLEWGEPCLFVDSHTLHDSVTQGHDCIQREGMSHFS